ncbi:hypothetical protein, partial [Paraburkholderia atlantica]|uniref:hypothetical protein n=1 Tax=Paraburkholderia atlantica TaxID=2654982 RepID=UPI00162006CA
RERVGGVESVVVATSLDNISPSRQRPGIDLANLDHEVPGIGSWIKKAPVFFIGRIVRGGDKPQLPDSKITAPPSSLSDTLSTMAGPRATSKS